MRLTMAFAGVVVISALLSAVVFTVVLVGTMRKSASEQIAETSKVASTHIGDIARGLEIYADLIASDPTFGQVLSFDSSAGIEQKIAEFKSLSHADVVAFVPRPEQYVQIKDLIFVNEEKGVLVPVLQASADIKRLLAKSEEAAEKGWVGLEKDIYLFAAKPVLHFGANMGLIFLGRQATDGLAKEVSQATGTEISFFNTAKIYGSSLSSNLTQLPRQTELGRLESGAQVQENDEIGGVSYFSYFSPIRDVDDRTLATLALHISNERIRSARNKTIVRVLFVAFLATIFSGVIGYFLARAIANPLQTITRGIRSIIEKGDLGIRIPGKFGAEIGFLTSSFNQLLGQLQTAHEKLAASERRMKEELTMASTVQEMLFPEKIVRYEGIELASFIDTSTETGGDWFGFGHDPAGKGISVMIADVTGHGMPAALITAIANGFFKGVQEAEDAFGQRLSTDKMLLVLNQIILESTKKNLMMTFFASTYEPASRTLYYANAGHNRPFICQKGEDGSPQVGVLPSDPSNRLGENEGLTFLEHQVRLKPGDIVVWYTDGILECENVANEMFGKRRLMKLLKECANESAEAIRERLITEAYRHFGDMPRKDDITLVVGKIL